MQLCQVGENREEIKEFGQRVVEELSKRLPEGYSVSIKEVVKTNDSRRIGITVHKEEAGTNAYPTFYADDLYAEFAGSIADVEKAAEYVREKMDEYEEQRMMVTGAVNNTDITEYEAIKDKLRVQLVKTDWNQEMTSQYVSRPVGEFSQIFRVFLGDETNASFAITEGIREAYNVTEEQLLKDAIAAEKKGSPSEPVLCYMQDVIADFTGRSSKRNLFEEVVPITDIPGVEIPFLINMYAMTTSDGMYGASLMVRDDLLSRAAEIIGDDFYVLPSSIHETILLPKADMDPEALTAMVREINEREVLPEERLADSAFLYDSRQHVLINTDTGRCFEPEMSQAAKEQVQNKEPKRKKRSR